jgi:hypothetical protein
MVKPGQSTPVELPVSSKGPWVLRYSTTRGGYARDNRSISVLSSPPTFTRTSGVVAAVPSTTH